MRKSLIITEVFNPELFIINQVSNDWLENELPFEVLTKNPSYPFGKIYPGFKNSFYSNSFQSEIKVHRLVFVPGYKDSLILKIINYFIFIISSFFLIISIGRRFDRIFIYQTGPLTNALSACLLKSIFNYNITLWVQDLWPESVYGYGFKKTFLREKILNFLVKYIYSKSDIILFSSGKFRDSIKSYNQYAKLFYTPNWPIINTKKINDIKMEGDFNFTFAGNIGKVQNLENLIKGFAKIGNLNSKVKLNIIGDGSLLNKLKTLSINLNVKNINFFGRLDIKKTSQYLKKSDVLIVSLKDNAAFNLTIPGKFQTYLTFNKPIYSICFGQINSYIDKYNLGLSANPDNINDIAQGINKFVKFNKSQLKTFSKNSQRLINKEFNKKKILRSIRLIHWGI